MATRRHQCHSVQVRGSLQNNEFHTPLSVKHLNLYEGKWQISVKSVVVEFAAETNKAVSITSPLVQQYSVSESKDEDVLSPINLKFFKLYSQVSSNRYLMSETTHVEVINFTPSWFNVTHPNANLSCKLLNAFGSPLERLPDHTISIEFYLRRFK